MRISDWSSDVCSSELNKVLIMRNHGLLTVGRTAGEAFMWMYRAERACYMQLLFQQAGAELNSIPAEVKRTRSDERSVGKECVGTCSSQWSTHHSQTPKTHQIQTDNQHKKLEPL